MNNKKKNGLLQYLSLEGCTPSEKPDTWLFACRLEVTKELAKAARLSQREGRLCYLAHQRHHYEHHPEQAYTLQATVNEQNEIERVYCTC